MDKKFKKEKIYFLETQRKSLASAIQLIKQVPITAFLTELKKKGGQVGLSQAKTISFFQYLQMEATYYHVFFYLLKNCRNFKHLYF